MSVLLAVDIGVKTGLALYGQDGRLLWYRSQNFGSTERLRRGIRGVLDTLGATVSAQGFGRPVPYPPDTALGATVSAQGAALPHLAWLVLEGGGPLADVWIHAATRRHIPVRQISAEVWRRQFLYAREQRSGIQAKESATDLARRVITWSGARRPTSLRDDAAEAILIGLWGILAVGWLAHLPAAIRR